MAKIVIPPDELLEDAIKLLQNQTPPYAHPHLFQEKLRIGYQRAVRILYQLMMLGLLKQDFTQRPKEIDGDKVKEFLKKL